MAPVGDRLHRGVFVVPQLLVYVSIVFANSVKAFPTCIVARQVEGRSSWATLVKSLRLTLTMVLEMLETRTVRLGRHCATRHCLAGGLPVASRVSHGSE